MTNPLVRLGELGQSPWYDYITRDLLASGELARLIRDDGLRGMTSNPTIFEKAIAGSRLYDDEIRSLTDLGKGAGEIFETLAIADVRAACDLFAPVYQATGGVDGLVSLEVSPDAGARYRGDDSGSGTALADGRSAECDDQDSGNAGGSAGDHALYRGRCERQRHPALLGRAVRRGHRRIPRRDGPADSIGISHSGRSRRWRASS